MLSAGDTPKMASKLDCICAPSIPCGGEGDAAAVPTAAAAADSTFTFTAGVATASAGPLATAAGGSAAADRLCAAAASSVASPSAVSAAEAAAAASATATAAAAARVDRVGTHPSMPAGALAEGLPRPAAAPSRVALRPDGAAAPEESPPAAAETRAPSAPCAMESAPANTGLTSSLALVEPAAMGAARVLPAVSAEATTGALTSFFVAAKITVASGAELLVGLSARRSTADLVSTGITEALVAESLGTSA